MHIGYAEVFSWAERKASLITHPIYNTGTLAITQGATALTGTSTLWNTNNAFSVKNMRAGGKIVIAGSRDVHEIASVSSDTAAVLLNAYVQSTETTATYSYWEDRYDLATDFLRPISTTQFSDSIPVGLIGRTEFRRAYPTNRIPGRPRIATIADGEFVSSTARVKTIRFSPPPNDAYKIDYWYVTNLLAVSASGTRATALSADADEPIVPLQYRHVIIWGALYHMYRDREDDVRSQEAKAEYEQLLLRMANDSEIGRPTPHFKPKTARYISKAKRPYSGRTGRHDILGKFDRFET